MHACDTKEMRLAKIIFHPCAGTLHNCTFIVDQKETFEVDIGYDRAWLYPPNNGQRMYLTHAEALDEAVRIAHDITKQEVIIIIDDHSIIRFLAKRFKRYGFDVEVKV